MSQIIKYLFQHSLYFRVKGLALLLDIQDSWDQISAQMSAILFGLLRAFPHISKHIPGNTLNYFMTPSFHNL
jgi:hypothetical protein